MKKRRALLLLIPTFICLTGCTFKGGVRRAKDITKKGLKTGIGFLDKLFKYEEEKSSDSEIEVVVPETEEESI